MIVCTPGSQCPRHLIFLSAEATRPPGVPPRSRSANTNGNGYDKFVDVNAHSTERRRRPPPSTPEGYLDQLPTLILLERLAIPMLATRLDGVVVYANPAFATMLGYPDAITLTGLQLPALLAGEFPDLLGGQTVRANFVLVAVPPINEQEEILRITESEDRLIAAESFKLERLRLLKTGLMDDLLTGRVRVGASA